MNPKSEFQKELNDGTAPPIPYSIINGNTQLISAMMTTENLGFFRRILNRFKNRGHYDLLDTLIFRNPNDIAVTVESQTKLNEGTMFIKKVVGCDHISYFVNPVSLAAFEAILEERFGTDFH